MALAAFVIFAVIGQILNVFIGLALDHFVSPGFAVTAFVALYILTFWVAWQLALLLFDREDVSRAESSPRDRPMPSRAPVLQSASR